MSASRTGRLLLAGSVAVAPFLVPMLTGRGAAQELPPQAPISPASSVKVDESPPKPVQKASKVLPGFKALYAQLPKAVADLRIALAEVTRAEAATRVALGQVLPTLNGSVALAYAPPRGGAGRPFTPTGATLQTGLTANATLINIRAFHQIGTQEMLEEVARLGVREVRRKLALSLSRGAASIAAAGRISEGHRTSLEAALQRLNLTRTRLAAGVGDKRDLVRAQQDVAAARAVIAPADESLMQAEEGLAIIIGSTGSVGLAIDLEDLEKEVQSFCGPPGGAKERLDVTIAKKQIDVAERNVDDITLKFLPTLTAQASTNVFGLAFDGPYAAGWQVGLTMSIPLYDGGIRYGEKRDRIASVEIARARAMQVELASLVERAQARRAIDVAVAAQTSAKEARDLAAEADRLARVAYANGIGTNFDLIDAGRRLRETETTLVLRDLDVTRARLALPFVEGNCNGVE